jgi:hypothetical protein
MNMNLNKLYGISIPVEEAGDQYLGILQGILVDKEKTFCWAFGCDV